MAGRPLAVPLDARFTHRGKYSSWLTKAKGDGAKAKWLSAACRRYFTIDFDNQVFFYTHSETGKDASMPIPFAEIIAAEQGAEELLFCPTARRAAPSRPGARPPPSAPGTQASPTPALALAAVAFPLAVRMASALGSGAEEPAPHPGGLRRSLSLTSVVSRRSLGRGQEFPFVLQTRERRIRLAAERETDMRDWVDLLNAASAVGQGLATEHRAATRIDESWPPDYSLLPPSMLQRFTGSTTVKPPASTSCKAPTSPRTKSEEASTAEGASDCGSASPAASCAGEEGAGAGGAGLLKDPATREEDTESTCCSGMGAEGSSGAPSPASERGAPLLTGDEAVEEAPPPAPQAAWGEAKPWEAQPAAPRPLQAADFGFEEDSDLADEEEHEEASPESSPHRRPPAAHLHGGSPKQAHAPADISGGAVASRAAPSAGPGGAAAGADEDADEGEGSDNEPTARFGAQQASRVAADLQLVARSLAVGAARGAAARGGGGGGERAAHGEKKRKSKASKHSEPREAEAEAAGRIAADLMLVQKAQAAAAQRHGTAVAGVAPVGKRGSSVPVREAGWV